jgi:hypothetical protein
MDHYNYCSPSWLNSVADLLGLKICAPQAIEAVRRYFCDVAAVTRFFTTFSDVIQGRDPRLVFNMDETQLSAKKRFRVLTVAGKLPLVKAQSKLPHLTGLCTISASGACFRPIVILKSLQKLKSLEEFQDYTSFATSTNGWITTDLFLMFTIDFCAQLTLYRVNLPDDIARQRVLLILDGHATRRKAMAMLIFDFFGVDVLILPGHCTHVLQPFDVGLASALKNEFKKLLLTMINEIMHAEGRTKSDTCRRVLVTCFVNALHTATSPINLKSAFAATGFVPLNAQAALESPFVHPGHDEVFQSIRRRPTSINASLLTSPDTIGDLFREQIGREITEADRTIFDFSALWPGKGPERSVDDGIAISPMPKIWVANETRTELHQI